ncbi:hypothetical protein EAO70_23200 [Streptomyces sp. adm13(2018)]|nr:hypothetical protein EAO70_23200 [Streptomyces sp. adm13(2018)]
MLSEPRSGRLAAWGNALLAGAVSPDEAALAIVGEDAVHRVLPDNGQRRLWRCAGGALEVRRGASADRRAVRPTRTGGPPPRRERARSARALSAPRGGHGSCAAGGPWPYDREWARSARGPVGAPPAGPVRAFGAGAVAGRQAGPRGIPRGPVRHGVVSR